MLMPGFHGSWSTGALVGAVTERRGGASGLPKRATARPVVPCLLVVSWLSTRMNPDHERLAIPNPSRSRQKGTVRASGAVVVLGCIASPTCCAKVPRPIGLPSIFATRCTPRPWSPDWLRRHAFAMLVRSVSGNRLIPSSPPIACCPSRHSFHARVRRWSRHRPSGERADRVRNARRRTRRGRPVDLQCGRSSGQREHREGRGRVAGFVGSALSWDLS